MVPARWENLCDSRRATGLALGEARVGTPEHLLAAIAAMALDDLDIFLDGPELPILDGGARVFLRLLEEAGRTVYPGERPVWRLRRPLQFRVDQTVRAVC